MALADAAGAERVIEAAAEELERGRGRERRARTAEQRESFLRGLERFARRDPDGAWIADSGGAVAGMAAAIRRGSFWGLSMLFVDPEWQSRGVGHSLLDAALGTADGAEIRMILSSPDPRAMRRYSLAGLDIHPTIEATGRIDSEAIPDDLDGRDGDTSDLDLVASVDADLRGRAPRTSSICWPSGRGCRSSTGEPLAATWYIETAAC